MRQFERLQMRLPAAGLDINDDGILDLADVDLVCFAVGNWMAPDFAHVEEGWDFDGDGKRGQGDLEAYLDQAFGTVPGDLNLDGVVDPADADELFRRDTRVGDYIASRNAGFNPAVQPEGLSYSRGNFHCEADWFGGEDEGLFSPALHNAAVQLFTARDGDISGNGRFDSSDLVLISQLGQAREVPTGELVRIFQLGTYEQ